jgi:DNA polymerase
MTPAQRNALHIDFETRSTVDLRAAGAHAYAEHETTDAWCMAWAQGDGPVEVWREGEPCPAPVAGHVAGGGVVVAHNASFELAIWNRRMAPTYGWPPLDPRQVRCTMAMAYAMALPGGLDDAAQAVGLTIRKDADGKRLMMQMSRPRIVGDDGRVIWWDDEARRERLHAYCAQDVEVERQLEKRLLALTDGEQELWALDQRINDRGVAIDLQTVDRLIRAVEKEKVRLDRAMAKATGGRVSACSQVAELEAWLGTQGVAVDGLAKADVTTLLGGPLPAAAREALRLRQQAAKSSVAKLKAMREGACADGRVRGTMQFHGAATGRWAGRRLQPQNLPRPGLAHDEIERVVGMIGGAR